MNGSKLLLIFILLASLSMSMAGCRGGIQHPTTTVSSNTTLPGSTTPGSITFAPQTVASIDTGTGLTFTLNWRPPSGTSRPYLTFYNNMKYDNLWMWIKPEGDDTVRIGITDYGQEAFGVLWQVVLPAVGDAVNLGHTFGFIQGEDTMDVNLAAPVSGTVLDVNQNVLKEHGLINASPYGTGWLVVVRMSNPSDLDLLLSPADYARLSLRPCHCNN